MTTDSTIKIKVDDQTGKGLKSAQGHLRNFTAAVGTVQGPLDGVTGRMSAFNSAMGRVGFTVAASVVAIAAFTKALYESFHAGVEFEKNQLQLQSLVKATDGAAGFSADQINKMAESLDRTTLASANGARQAAGALLSFKKISGPVFEETLRLSQDMVAVFGGDLRSSAVLLAKALEDPISGLTSLNRKGVTFTQIEKDQIKAMAEAGKMAEAQATILEKLEGQIGGAAVGQAGGTAGAIDGMAFAWTQLMESLGETTAGETAVSVINSVRDALAGLRNMITDEVDKPLDIQLQNQISLIKELKQAREEEAKSFFGLSASEAAAFDRKIEQAEMQIRIIHVQKEIQDEQNAALKEKSDKIQSAMAAETEAAAQSKQYDQDAIDMKKYLDDITKETEKSEQEIFKNKVARIVDENRRLNLVAKNRIDQNLKREKDDEKAAKKKLELEQSVATNIASIGANLSSIFKDQSRAAFKAHQGFAISESIINSYQAYTNALANIPAPFNFAAAGAVLAAGLAKVHAIGAMSPGSTGGVSSGGGISQSIPDAPSQPRQIETQEAPATNIFRIEIGGRVIEEVIVDGLLTAQSNDRFVAETEEGFERVIFS